MVLHPSCKFIGRRVYYCYGKYELSFIQINKPMTAASTKSEIIQLLKAENIQCSNHETGVEFMPNSETTVIQNT
jgi:hypothetical protein